MMINSIPSRSVTESVVREVHEHRAPTDESVKLLREMEASAKAEVSKSIHLKDNTFDAKIEIVEEPIFRQQVYRTLFKINGTRYETENFFDDFDFDKGLAIEAVRKTMSDKIAKVILLEAVKELK